MPAARALTARPDLFLMMTCYDDVMRTIIELPGSQLDALDAWCRREDISRAEAIRRAVAVAIGQQAALGRDRAYGLWRDRGIAGLDWERTIRAEWEATPAPVRTSTARRRTRRK
jgi:ribbon-helix-helix CopG family protein